MQTLLIVMGIPITPRHPAASGSLLLAVTSAQRAASYRHLLFDHVFAGMNLLLVLRFLAGALRFRGSTRFRFSCLLP